MEAPSVITRADDFGSIPEANKAILQAVTKGCLIKNVSCMAGGLAIEEGASLLKGCDTIDIGLHLTLLSEWDSIKWQPVAPKEKISSLLDKNGEFYQSPQQLASARPELDEIIVEYEAQLDRLIQLGLKVNYVDSHMAPELFIPGLEKALEEWISSKGLIDANKYYYFADPILPVWGDSKQAYFENIEVWLDALEKDHQYLYFMHPTIKSDKTHLLSNEQFPPGIVERERDFEYQSAISINWKEWLQDRDIQLLRYSDAVAAGSNNALRQLFNL